MVTTEEEEVVGVFDLVGQEETDTLGALIATIHIITKEKKLVIEIRFACNFKYS